MNELLEELLSLKNEEKAKSSSRFFKTRKGQYGEGDLFLGINIPTLRFISKKYYNSTSLKDIEALLKNPYHEIRMTALILLIYIYEKSSAEVKKEIFHLYLNNVDYINNWDLVDVSAPKLVGNFVYENKNFNHIYNLANSNHLWSNRIAIVSTHYLIKKGDFELILELSEKFLTHKHDLIHKAVGWMLREMGKIDEAPLNEFLNKHHKTMPRTMLRYSIEKFPKEKREFYISRAVAVGWASAHQFIK